MKSDPLPSGGWKSCRPATCIGCSRDSPMRNMESVGEISFIDVTVPFQPEVTMTNTVGRVDGKVAFITGAARGQGREHAIRLAEEGADVIAIDLCAQIETVPYPLVTPADLEETVGAVEALGRRIVARAADVRDPHAVRAAIDAGVEELGRLDIVVANAGIGVMKAWDEVTPEIWRDTIDTNLTGVWNTCAATIPHLISAAGGSIIIISSTAGLKGQPFMVPYAASKHGVVGI